MRVTQDEVIDELVRRRIRGLRVARGWSLDDLATATQLSPSTLSRLETGHRRISLDQLTAIARALGTTLDHLVESVSDDDVVIRPERHGGVTSWVLNRGTDQPGLTVAKMRITKPTPQRGADELRVHPGKDWFTVLSGAVVLLLGDRTITVQTGEAVGFSTMVPHAFGAADGVAEIIGIFDQSGQRAHLS